MSHNDIKAVAFENVVFETNRICSEYFAKRPLMVDESADWSKEEIREFLLRLIDVVEKADYEVGAIIDGREGE